MADDPDLNPIVNNVLQVLKPLAADARLRVLRAAMILLGLDDPPPRRGRPRREP